MAATGLATSERAREERPGNRRYEQHRLGRFPLVSYHKGRFNLGNMENDHRQSSMNAYFPERDFNQGGFGVTQEHTDDPRSGNVNSRSSVNAYFPERVFNQGGSGVTQEHRLCCCPTEDQRSGDVNTIIRVIHEPNVSSRLDDMNKRLRCQRTATIAVCVWMIGTFVVNCVLWYQQKV